MQMPAVRPSVAHYVSSRHRMLIGSDWVDAASGRRRDVIDPSSGRVAASAPEADGADVDLAVAAARRSFDDRRWRGIGAAKRAAILWRLSDLVEENADELAEIEVLNTGMPKAFAMWMATNSAEWLRFYAGQTMAIFGRNSSEPISGGGRSMHAYTVREPLGVAAMILPWNGPLGSFVLKLAPALASGCSIVAKPSENTPLTALRIGQLALEAGLPDGVLNIVTGDGPGAGQALIEHPDVNKISFTGSTAVGKHIVGVASSTLKRVTLELGGKSPVIILDDADLDRAIPVAAGAIFNNTGQICFAGSRLFVQRRSYDRVVAGIADIARSLKLGHGLDPSTQIGPVISAKQRERVLSYIEAGRLGGAELVAGGAAIAGDGFYVQPTVFANVERDMKIVREEIFGPVLVATPMDDLDAIIAAANDTEYGLGSGVFTRDVSKAHLIADRLQAGNVWVNCYGINHSSMPFGGFKASGWGRELGTEGMDAFLETKSVFIDLQ